MNLFFFDLTFGADDCIDGDIEVDDVGVGENGRPGPEIGVDNGESSAPDKSGGLLGNGIVAEAGLAINEGLALPATGLLSVADGMAATEERWDGCSLDIEGARMPPSEGPAAGMAELAVDC